MRRKVCSRCERPASACLCGLVTEINSDVEVVIFQHPLETRHPKGSARLLHLSLPGSQLVTGEKFEHHRLLELLHGPLPGLADDTRTRQAMLLYPDLPSLPPGASQQPITSDATNLRLIILDGTWRKSRKMLHLNPLLQTLPRLNLSPASASRYLIRRAHGANQLSTLEAACFALSMLENREDRYAPLLQAFERFVAMQEQWFGARDA